MMFNVSLMARTGAKYVLRTDGYVEKKMTAVKSTPWDAPFRSSAYRRRRGSASERTGIDTFISSRRSLKASPSKRPGCWSVAASIFARRHIKQQLRRFDARLIRRKSFSSVIWGCLLPRPKAHGSNRSVTARCYKVARHLLHMQQTRTALNDEVAL